LALAEGRQGALAAEAVALLEPQKPGAALVAAYAQLASVQAIAGAYAEAIAAADRARALAETLGLPEPARALGYHGYSLALLGDADGLGEQERAFALLIEQGAGRDAATLQNNLALARYPLQGPARSLAAFEEGIAFCEQRGLTERMVALEGNCPGLLVELGRAEEALERAARPALALDASGLTHLLTEIRAVELATRLARGEREGASAGADWLVETARAIGAADTFVFALATAASALVADAAQRACALLSELEQTPGAQETPYFARQLPWMVRDALAAGDPNLARRLTDTLEPRFPLNQHALTSAQAQIAEAAGEHTRAATLYTDAATGWHQFGNVPEHAHALLGQGRCLLALADPTAEQPLRQAAELFSSMGYRPALAATNALLEQTTAAAS
jgi:hypothetical protein